MATNPLRVAQQRARQDNHWLAELFARVIGSAEHPRGRVLSAYRTARRELARLIDHPAQALDVIDALGESLLGITAAGLVEAIRHGQDSAVFQARVYNADGQEIGFTASVPSFTLYQSAIMGTFNAQRSILRTLITIGAGVSLVVGDRNRVGALRPGPVMTESARWLATGMHDGFKATIVAPGWNKQAIPVLDEYTTDCCLNVAGQIAPLEGKFHLTGEPRFADDMDWPPFHWHCRTSVALYRASYDDGLTEAIRNAAQRIRESK